MLLKFLPLLETELGFVDGVAPDRRRHLFAWVAAAVAGPLVPLHGDAVLFAPLLVVAEATARRQSDPVLR